MVAGGGKTIGLIVAFVSWPNESPTMYRRGVAGPLKTVLAGHAATPAAVHGSNVTVPFAFNVYLPWFDTLTVVRLQFVAE
jgi:hypothetical protein